MADQPTTVEEAVWDFERSLLEALVIVLAVSLVSLGWRTGIVVATSVPLVLGGVAVVMLAMGWNLERISLGSLIIALGLLVDDAIIALEMMVVKMEAGWDRVKAAAFSYSATAMPRLTGALITVAGFMPIGFVEVDHRRVRGRHLLDRRRRGGVLVDRLRHLHAVPRGEDAAEGLRQAPPRRRSVRHARSTASCAALIDCAVERRWLVIGVTVGALVAGARRHEVRAAAVLPEQLAARAGRRPAPEGRRLVRGDHRAGEEAWKRSSRRTRTCASSPPTPAPARRASTCRSTPSCRTPATRSSS